MLGKPSKRSEKHLRAEGTRAPATVTAIAEKGMAVTNGAEGVVSNTELLLKTSLRVEPTGEPSFEIEKRFRYSQFGVPSVGQQVAVIYDPEDHDKLMIDREAGVVDPAFADQLAGGRPTGGVVDMNALLATVQQAKQESGGDRQALAAKLQAQFGQGMVIDASGGGDAAAAWQAAAMNGMNGAAPTPAEDPLDRLEKLAKLHKDGVLTDAEFAAQKAKILDDVT